MSTSDGTIRWTRDTTDVRTPCDRCGQPFEIGDAVAYVEPTFEDGTYADMGAAWHEDGCPKGAA